MPGIPWRKHLAKIINCVLIIFGFFFAAKQVNVGW
jgi:hypothetical protein